MSTSVSRKTGANGRISARKWSVWRRCRASGRGGHARAGAGGRAGAGAGGRAGAGAGGRAGAGAGAHAEAASA
ncbi:hypothetical protein DVA86_06930 [Streptomyces armeniacus]|uniref:Uncharacterized protein n=1 Tax=Streptomyces armeniacus TaxID=83291 RepID=A0A345XLA9_9ACTN|nr:hypothetical protein DVA86_06930 [Streptomyces armeniacus]